MKRAGRIDFDSWSEDLQKRKPELAVEYARQFAELPLSQQLGIRRRKMWLTQQKLARRLKVRQPHVARVESAKHDPRLSSVEKQARALHCRCVLVPDALVAQVARLVAAA